MKKVNIDKKTKKLYFDETTKKFYLIWKIIFILILFVVSLSFFIPILHNFLWINIVNEINGLMFTLLDFSPFLASRFYEIAIAVFIILIVLNLILNKNTRISYKKRNRYYNLVNRVSCIASLIIISIFISDFITFAVPKINYKYFPNNVDKIYTENDLIELGNYFKNDIIEMSDDFIRVDGEINYDNNLVDRAIGDLNGISNEYRFLEGLYPNKVGYMLESELIDDDGSYFGYTSGYGVMVDKNQNDIHLLNTITHEFCHTKGIMKESEAEFCAFIAGMESNDKFSNYSAKYTAFYRVTSVLAYINPKANDDVEEEFLNLCLNKNYVEACSFYPKEVDFMLAGNDYFEIETYRLRNYAMYEDNIIDILETLYYGGNARFEINEEDIDILDIKNLIKLENKDTVKIIVNFNDEFEQIASYLKENQKYFKSIYQLDSDYEYENDLEADEALEYYLSPFDKKTLDLLYADEYDSEYAYERSVRLLLEYYR